jgi:uncharacterized membrane protein HdeD (DUF308 family)
VLHSPNLLKGNLNIKKEGGDFLEATMQRIPWWPFVLGGLALLAGGIVALIWPDITLIVLVILWGAIALVDGASTALGGIFTRGALRWFLLLSGVISALIGAAILAWPDITALVLLYIIGAWAVIAGVMKFLSAMFWPEERKADRWLLVLSGLISVTLGVLILAWPAAGAIAIVWLIGIYAIIFGVLLVAVGFNVRRLNR